MARDIFHYQVVEALEKDQWEITHDPYPLHRLKRKLAIDLGAEKMVAAEKGMLKIAIEIKSFLSHSRIYDYHDALGQYKTYFRILKKIEPERILYLAVPLDAYTDFFDTPFGREAIKEEDLKILVYNPSSKIIVKWIE